MKYKAQLFLFLVLGFIFATVFGTLSHEFGHFVVAKYFGYDVVINYAGTTYIPNNYFTEKREFFITLGGPIETILTGSIGCLFLFLNRKSYSSAKKLSVKQWLFIFISLFWLRQIFNFLSFVVRYFQHGKFSIRNDEIKIDRYLGFTDNTTITVTALIASVILITVIFRFIPRSQRLIFILSGLVGGFLGNYLWMNLIGKVILP